MGMRTAGLLLILACTTLVGAAPSDPGETLWSLTPVRRPTVPGDDASGWVRNPIDRFVLKTLKEHELSPAPEADRRTLIRRLTFDLIGLPPTPEEVEAFERDKEPDAYDRLVGRLLDSPHYGERWARHWLDLVRFAETHGYERDGGKPNAWRYRDWVVRALNRDLPYDRFVIEQLAGDELPDASPETRMATGIYRLGPIDDEPADKLMDRFDQLDDVIKTVGTTMLGLTIHCARCHDHKFDPISQRDYYRMASFFVPGKQYVRDNNASIEVDIATPEEQKRFTERNASIDRDVKRLRDDLEAIRAPRRDELLTEHRRGLDRETLAALDIPTERRNAEEKRRADAAKPKVEVKDDEINSRLSAMEKTRKADIERQIGDLEAGRPSPLPKALGLTDAGAMAEATHLLTRGDAHKPGAEVAPGFLSAVDPSTPTIIPPAGNTSTGRRLALARWIARAENPLTARVMINRLWQHHFGQGLVASPSDFGNMGDEPSDSELLDWLASEFVAKGWSLKSMHRLMVTSSAYRQSGRWNAAAAKDDPGNAWLWRMAPRRLEAEPIRDAILAVSGALNLQIGGPSVTPPIDPVVLAGQSIPGSGWGKSDERAASRRSLYVLVKRTLPLPELEILDAADTSEPCPRRSVTTTAPQALTNFNGTFAHEQAARFAGRLVAEAGNDPVDQVDRAFSLAFGRHASAAERGDALDFLDDMARRVRQRPKAEDRADPTREALRTFCLVLLNSNEFLTID